MAPYGVYDIAANQGWVSVGKVFKLFLLSSLAHFQCSRLPVFRCNVPLKSGWQVAEELVYGLKNEMVSGGTAIIEGILTILPDLECRQK